MIQKKHNEQKIGSNIEQIVDRNKEETNRGKVKDITGYITANVFHIEIRSRLEFYPLANSVFQNGSYSILGSFKNVVIYQMPPKKNWFLFYLLLPSSTRPTLEEANTNNQPTSQTTTKFLPKHSQHYGCLVFFVFFTNLNCLKNSNE